jgi:hypothetical protein
VVGRGGTGQPTARAALVFLAISDTKQIELRDLQAPSQGRIQTSCEAVVTSDNQGYREFIRPGRLFSSILLGRVTLESV